MALLGGLCFALLCFYCYRLLFTMFVDKTEFWLRNFTQRVGVDTEVPSWIKKRNKRDLLEVAMQAFGRALDDQQNRMFSKGAVRPDRFLSDTFPNCLFIKESILSILSVLSSSSESYYPTRLQNILFVDLTSKFELKSIHSWYFWASKQILSTSIGKWKKWYLGEQRVLNPEEFEEQKKSRNLYKVNLSTL